LKTEHSYPSIVIVPSLRIAFSTPPITRVFPQGIFETGINSLLMQTPRLVIVLVTPLSVLLVKIQTLSPVDIVPLKILPNAIVPCQNFTIFEI